MKVMCFIDNDMCDILTPFYINIINNIIEVKSEITDYEKIIEKLLHEYALPESLIRIAKSIEFDNSCSLVDEEDAMAIHPLIFYLIIKENEENFKNELLKFRNISIKDKTGLYKVNEYSVSESLFEFLKILYISDDLSFEKFINSKSRKIKKTYTNIVYGYKSKNSMNMVSYDNIYNKCEITVDYLLKNIKII